MVDPADAAVAGELERADFVAALRGHLVGFAGPDGVFMPVNSPEPGVAA